MADLEGLKRGATVRGILANAPVIVIDVDWHGSEAVFLTYKEPDGNVDQELIYRDQAERLEIVEAGRPWSFDADGALFRLVSEANRIGLAHLFDPHLAVHTSLVQPLPHQITAVYEEMLPRQPLRFLLADDPGAGKTIMAGLLIKELRMRGALERCMIVCPGSLVEQWQDELFEKFQLPFEIMTNDKLEAARTGNWFEEEGLVICRLDKLARDEDTQEKLKRTRWDLVVCDEAHKMSASVYGREIKRTKRHQLGQFLSGLTHHFLLMTATPHNGKEEDFQLFLSLLDGDRFEGRYREGVHVSDASDLMRRLVKEQLVKFDGKPLFPERRAYTVNYRLSQPEADLYRAVTEYVREEFNRAEALENDGRRGTVGFALTALQRRLASSPEAIYHSIRRRKERLEKRVREVRLLGRGAPLPFGALPSLDEEDWEDFEDLPGEEYEEAEERIVDEASAARTIEELEAEISTLQSLEQLANTVRRSGTDRKWDELRGLLQENDEIVGPEGDRRKLVIFTEHKDTLDYLIRRIRTLLGRDEAVVTIHGGLRREERKNAEHSFVNDPKVLVLVATDAAGEGINLQRAHLMVNYDLPWNPNRLEQRFGRIHRIGQTEVCHLWNLVAEETREGDVYLKLLKKLEVEKEALGGAVFDVLGQAMQGSELRKLLMEAVRYGDRPDIRAKLDQVVDTTLDRGKLRSLIEGRALAHDSMDARKVREVREEMERIEARRLQPHFISGFFREAFQHLGGTLRAREEGRWEITHVPSAVRSRDRMIGRGAALLRRYERITFEKERITIPGKPRAEFVCPGHPLLDATIDLVLERYRDLLRRGAVLVDEKDPGEEPRALLYLEHSIRDGKPDTNGKRRTISRRMQFIEIEQGGQVRAGGYAPFLDYAPLGEDDRSHVEPLLDAGWLKEDLEKRAVSEAVQSLVPEHIAEVRRRTEERVEKTLAAVKERLTKEINYWDHRAIELQRQEAAGRQPKMNAQRARELADELSDRLRRRIEELEQERRISPAPPTTLGGALIIPRGLLSRLRGDRHDEPDLFARETKRVELAGMEAVMAAERALGHQPTDVSTQNLGWDIDSRVGPDDPLRFIEVKGRVCGARDFIITKNEIIASFTEPEKWILALVEVPPSEEFSKEDVFAVREQRAPYGDGLEKCRVRYLKEPFGNEPDFGETGRVCSWKEFWERGVDVRPEGCQEEATL